MTGAELISKEREEQLNKHFWKAEDDDLYIEGELLQAAECLLSNNFDEYPINWSAFYKNKLMKKSRKEQIIIAGALLAAEIDRLQRAGI